METSCFSRVCLVFAWHWRRHPEPMPRTAVRRLALDGEWEFQLDPEN